MRSAKRRSPRPLPKKTSLDGLRVDRRRTSRLPGKLVGLPDLLEGGLAQAEERSRPRCTVCGRSVERAEPLTVFFCRSCLGVVGPAFLALPAEGLSFEAQVQEGLSVALPPAVVEALGIGPCAAVRWVLSAQGLMLEVNAKAGEVNEADDSGSVV